MKILERLIKKRVQAEMQRAYQYGYEVGVNAGYELGLKTADSQRTGQGFILPGNGGQMQKDIEIILKEKGV